MIFCTQIISLFSRHKLPGADELFKEQFNHLLATGDYVGAAKVAKSAPGDLLRNQETINKFKTVPVAPGQHQPLLQYFSTLLESGKLNRVESLELVQPVLAQNRKNLIETWIMEDKLEFTVELGDLVKPYDTNLAQSIYLKSNSADKVVQGFVETGQFDQIIPYCKTKGYQPDFLATLKTVCGTNPESALQLAKMLSSREGGKEPQVNLNSVYEIFMSYNRIQECTAFLLEALAGDRQEEANLQTKLFEINLIRAPKVAEAIFQMKMFTKYDKDKIAQLCEKAQLYLRALENYSDINDIRRVMLNTHVLKKEEIVEFLGKLDPQKALGCMYDLLKMNNLQVVVEAAVKYNGVIATDEILKMFETFGSFDGIYFFAGSILSTTEDPDVYLKYIEAATKLNNFREVERVIRETKFYDPVKVKDFLKEFRLQDPRPLIYLCDMHNYVEELTRYLYKNNFQRHIEIYLHKVNTQATPKVMGTLLDLDCDEIQIKTWLNNIRICSIEDVVHEFESRNKLKVLQLWLEARANEGNQNAPLHTALAKIYIDTNKDPNAFLINNQYYDCKEVGKFCEDRDPHLAFIAYRKAWGKCDEELIELTNKNYLYRLQARYLVERQDLELWKGVLTEENTHRKHLVEQVVSTALPETKNPDEVSITVKAFIEADLPQELIELLDKIVLHHSDFSNNSNLQTLLIYTAIKSDTTRVMDYINRLDNYNAPKLAQKALENELYEEALTIHTKFGNNEQAMEVLLTRISALDRAAIFAERLNEPVVWTKLGSTQLEHNMVSEAISSFIKANDPQYYILVIAGAEREGNFEQLVDYLIMAREQIKEIVIDGELIYAYAKCNRLNDLEEFIAGTNTADLSAVGDRCYNEKLWEAGKLLFSSVGNNAKLASCLVYLKQFQAALEVLIEGFCVFFIIFRLRKKRIRRKLGKR